MCFNIVIYNPRNKNLERIFQVINRNSIINNDGFSIWSNSVYLRTLNFNEFRKAQEQAIRDRIVHIHFRKASSGSVNLDNVHMWKINNYYVSHNGFVGIYMESALLRWYYESMLEPYESVFYTATESDTYKLVHEKEFEEYLRERNWKGLYKHLKACQFYGVLFLTNENEMIGISMNKPIHITYHQKDNILMFSNQPINFKSFTKFNIRFRISSKHEGILYFNFNDEILKVIK
jgi:hypothetical protein